jgi:hypothetical protein
MSSSQTRIKNTVSDHEENSDKYVPNESYYIVVLSLNESEQLTKIAKKIAKTSYGDDQTPLAVYLCPKRIYILFSSLEDKRHYLNGSHHLLISKFVSEISRETNTHVNGTIIEFDSRTKVIVYFHSKIHETSNNYAFQLIKPEMTKQNYTKLTFTEVVDKLLKQKPRIVWSELDTSLKFGVMYKYMPEKQKYCIISEAFDIQNIERYSTFLFE